MEKNTPIIVYIEAWDLTSNTRKTGDAGNIVVQISQNGNAFVIGDGIVAEINDKDALASGVYTYTASADETDADSIYFLVNSSTSNVVCRLAGLYTQIMRGTDGALLSNDIRLNNIDGSISAVSANVWNQTIEETYKASDLLKIITAITSGKTQITTVDGITTVTFRNVADTLNRVSAVMTGSERTTVTLDPS